MTYHHKQPGFVTLSAFIVAFLFFIDLLTLTIVFWSDHVPSYVNPVLIFLALLMIVLAVLFSSMTIKIDDGHLSWHFALKFWKKSLDLQDIRAVQVVRNRWWYGWGIKRIPGGWLYNVSGMSAVELQLPDERTIRLGSDEPEKLARTIKEAISSAIPQAKT